MRYLALLVASGAVVLSAQSPAKIEFFESQVRPLLIARCGPCHGDTVQMNGIQLTSRTGMHNSGVVVAGDTEGSRLIQAIRYGSKIKMPPTGKLPDKEVETLERWVTEGAIWPDTPDPVPTNKKSGYWAFQPVKKSTPPQVNDPAWAHSDIDRFILAKLEEKKIAPNPDADKYTLLRRLTMDITGLLPKPEEVEAFVADKRPDALERVVDRLLASPAYGDCWGRHWLDVTYYADTTGVGRRIPLPEAWRYRDYVIQSFNDDKPYKQFVHEQLAGTTGKPEKGEEEKANDASIASATGFLTLGPWAWFSYDRVQLRLDVADLQTDLVGRTFLGLTVGCARCHDHKFDPIPNKDYYGMVGIFLSTKTLSKANGEGGINTVPLPQSVAEVRKYSQDLEQWEKRLTEVEAANKINAVEQTRVKKEIADLNAKPKNEATAAALKIAEEQLQTLQKATGSAGDRQILPFTRYMKPKTPFVYAAEDMDYPEDARIAVRGDAHQLGASTPRHFLTAVSYEKQPVVDPQEGSGREQLADWIANEKNPLTARVYVNRIWHHLFGDGIVASTENFGARGESPTHPELLDYLAASFVENGWSTKKLIREIVLSHTYRVSSAQNAKANEIDADNKLLWRSNRRRLDAEAIRDAVLEVSGHLDMARGGPSLPLTAQNVHTIAPFFLEDDSVIEDRVKFRRTIYQPIMRNSQMDGIDILNLFDFKDPDQVVGTRMLTTVPTQMLYLMNAPFLKDESRRLAEQLLAQPDLTDAARVSRLTMAALGRPATPRDVQQARQFVSDFESRLRKVSDSSQNPEVEAWGRFCHAVLVSSEFLYRR